MHSFSRAQAGLEYLMTYGWALVLIITVASVLFFVFSPSSGEKVNFSLSNNKQILFKAGNVKPGGGANSGELLLQNSSGGTITLTKLEASTGGSFTIPTTATLNGTVLSNPANFSIIIPAGQQIKLAGINITPGNVSGSITLTYTDKDGYTKTAAIQGSGSAGSTSGSVAQGQPCTGSGQGNCGTGFYCVDGVCCNTTCTGQTCQTCGSFSSAGVGHCGFVNSSTADPRNDCIQGLTVSDGCRLDNCSGYDYSCGIFNGYGQGGCPTCTYCADDGYACNISLWNGSQQPPGCTAVGYVCQNGICVHT